MATPDLKYLEQKSLTGSFADVKAYLLADTATHFPEVMDRLLIGSLTGKNDDQIKLKEIETHVALGLDHPPSDHQKKIIQSHAETVLSEIYRSAPATYSTQGKTSFAQAVMMPPNIDGVKDKGL